MIFDVSARSKWKFVCVRLKRIVLYDLYQNHLRCSFRSYSSATLQLAFCLRLSVSSIDSMPLVCYICNAMRYHRMQSTVVGSKRFIILHLVHNSFSLSLRNREKARKKQHAYTQPESAVHLNRLQNSLE